ncbi:MAG: hypothetical protein ABI137_14380 [Antricoccus sp.]
MITARQWRPRRPSPWHAASAFAAIMRWLLRVALPITGAIAMLLLFPYHAVSGGVNFSVEGTIFSRPGFSAGTTIGDWVFPISMACRSVCTSAPNALTSCALPRPPRNTVNITLMACRRTFSGRLRQSSRGY